MVKRKSKLAALLRARHDAEVRKREEFAKEFEKEKERLEWLQKQKSHKTSMTFTGTDKIQEKLQEAKSIKNLSLKPQIRAKRMRNQAQYKDTSKYRTSLQQANDLAARSIKRLRTK